MISIEPFIWLGVAILIIGSILLARYALRKAFESPGNVSTGRDYVASDTISGGRDHAQSDLFEPPSMDMNRLF